MPGYTKYFSKLSSLRVELLGYAEDFWGRGGGRLAARGGGGKGNMQPNEWSSESETSAVYES